MIHGEFLGDEDQGNYEEIRNGKTVNISYPCGNQFSTCSPIRITLKRGIYSISLYGGRGGNADTCTGGLGGFVSSIIEIYERQSFYLYIGGQGTDQTTQQPLTGGWNGGGSSNSDRGSGGGSTDIRTSDKLDSRILVAGGGGGAHRNVTYPCQNGGSGGGSEGQQGKYQDTGIPCYGIQSDCVGGNTSSKGKFGYGDSTTTTGAGGGGYWGGGSAGRSGSSGGSGYAKTISNKKFRIYYYTYEGILNNGSGYASFSILNYMHNTKTYQQSGIYFILTLIII